MKISIELAGKINHETEKSLDMFHIVSVSNLKNGTPETLDVMIPLGKKKGVKRVTEKVNKITRKAGLVLYKERIGNNLELSYVHKDIQLELINTNLK